MPDFGVWGLLVILLIALPFLGLYLALRKLNPWIKRFLKKADKWLESDDDQESEE